MIKASQEALDYLNQLSDRYTKSHGEVLTFGNGDCGQLAHGIQNDDDISVRFPRVVYSLRDKKVCIISCGGLHNAVVTEDGKVYTWGCADEGSLGRDGDESLPMLVTDNIAHESIVTVACGDGQTIAVTAGGAVYAWGCYKDKEGKKWFNASPGCKDPLKDIKKQQNTPMLIPAISGAVEVACGSTFNLALCGDGVVYSWGLGESGELGRKVRKVRVIYEM
jgi:regulator of chromosome condensation